MDRIAFRLKAATRRLVKLAGGVEEAAQAHGSRVGKSMLARYGSVNEPEAFMPADVIAVLESEVGEPVVTSALAEAQGYALVAVTPDRSNAEAVDVLRMGVRLASEVGEFNNAAYAAGENLSMPELDQLIKEAEDVKIASSQTHDRLCRLKAARLGSARLSAVGGK